MEDIHNNENAKKVISSSDAEEEISTYEDTSTCNTDATSHHRVRTICDNIKSVEADMIKTQIINEHTPMSVESDDIKVDNNQVDATNVTNSDSVMHDSTDIKVENNSSLKTEDTKMRINKEIDSTMNIQDSVTDIKLQTEKPSTNDIDKGLDFFDYLERGEFSSEQFKIEIKNLPKYYGIHQLRKLINVTLDLNSNKVKTPRPNSQYAFVCFRNDEDREKALVVLKEYKWKGNVLTAIKAKPAPDPLIKKRQNDRNEQRGNKKQKVDDRSVADRIKEAVTPYWNLEYSEQLVKKHNEVKDVIRKIGSELCHQNSELRTYFNQQRSLYGLPCQLLDIRHDSNIVGYRNKCEFTVGINEETGLKTVGFRIGSYVTGVTGVGPVDHLLHVPTSMKVAANQFQDFVRASTLAVYNPVEQVGEFQQLTARCTKDELMLIVGVSPKHISEDKVAQLKKDLVQFFFEGEGRTAKVTSLYYQPLIKKISNDDDSSTPEYLHGTTHIYETILGLKFRISPQAFFQVNTAAAEILYKAAIELAGVTKDTTVLDVCCGTGTIGLCFANSCNQVLGLEIIPQAVEDAKRNAKENNIENAEFYVGKAEDIMYSVFARAKNEDVVAIVDPPRAGLHSRAITTLRKMTKLKKLVYISCNPKQALKNFIDLGRRESKTMHGPPFVPVKAVTVDLFPYTPHCELVMYFQRVDTLPEAKTGLSAVRLFRRSREKLRGV